MEGKVLDLLYEGCNDKIIYKKRNIDLFNTGLLDSMSFIELLISIEDEFDIEIFPEEINKEQMKTPNLLITFVAERVH